MGNLLNKTDRVYYQILYTLWQLAVYYADFMGYDPPASPLDMVAGITSISGLKELSFIRIELPAYEEFDCNRMKEILQEYLTIILLPQSQIPLYMDGETIIEPLYVFKTYYDHDPRHTTLSWIMLYINNMDAYNLYKEDLRK